MKKQQNNTKNCLNKPHIATIRLLVMIIVSLFFVGFASSFTWTDGNVMVYWMLNESSGQLIDSTGKVNLTNQGTPLYQPTNGLIGGAIGFNSNDDLFQYNVYGVSGLNFSDTHDFSYNFWVKRNATGSDAFFLTSGNYSYPDEFSCGTATQKLYCSVGGTNIYNVGFPEQVWTMFTITRNDTGNRFNIYVNGVYNTTYTTPKFVNSTVFNIGDSRLDRFPNLSLDEVGIWNRSLTNGEITELYNSGEGLTYLGSNTKVVLNYPVNYNNQTSKTVNFNVSAITYKTDIKISNVTLYIDGVLNQSDTSEFNGTYIFTKYLSYGNHNWSIDVYDNSSTLVQSSVRTITIGIYENSRTYTTPAMEGTTKSFVLNISTGSPVTSAYLNYNGTLKSVNINANDFTTLTSSFVLPSVTTNTNITFFWQVYTALGNFISSSSNQTINNLAFDNCSTNKIVLYNFTIKDEVSQNILKGSDDNTTGKINIQIYPFASLNLFVNYSQLMNVTNPFYVCINSSLGSGDKFSIDAQVEYDAILNAKEYYYIQNDTFDINYINNNISLYDLDNSNAQTFRIIYLDSSGIPVENAIIEIQRKYIEEDAYKIVEIAQTDKDGETQAKLQLNDVIYNFVIKKYGVTIDSFNKKFVRCDNYVYNLCEIKLNSFSSYIQTEDFTKGDDFEFTLTYNHSSRIITSVFNIPSGDSSLIVINATLLDNLGTTLACSDSITSSSGTLNCAVPNAIGNGTVYANVYKDGVLQGGGEVSLNTRASDIYGTSLVFLLIFLYLTLLGMGIGDNPIIMGVFMVLGVILAVTLNMVDTGVSRFVGAGATILWFIIAVIIVLIKGGKRG